MTATDILTLSTPIYLDLVRKNPCATAGFLITGYPGSGRNETVLVRSLAHANGISYIGSDSSE